MAVLEAFVYDPLLNWRLIETNPKAKKSKSHGAIAASGQTLTDGGDTLVAGAKIEGDVESLAAEVAPLDDGARALPDQQAKPEEDAGEAAVAGGRDELDEQPELNKKALDIVQRVRDKLTGRDFATEEPLAVDEQVDKLINQATNNENLCQSYIGWCPFW